MGVRLLLVFTRRLDARKRPSVNGVRGSLPSAPEPQAGLPGKHGKLKSPRQKLKL